MNYLSPVHFVRYSANKSLDDLTREEYENEVQRAFSNNGKIVINEHSYTKEILLNLLIDIDFAEFQRFNSIVANSPDLLAFLEDSVLRNNSSLNKIGQILGADQALVNYLKPYLADSIAVVISELLEQHSFYDLSLLVDFAVKYGIDAEDNCLAPIDKFIDESIAFFSGLTVFNYTTSGDRLALWTNYQWNRLLNVLPDRYETKKTKLASAILKFIKDILNKDQQLAKDINKYLCQVKGLGASVSYEISELTSSFDAVDEYEAVVDQHGGSPWRLILSILVFLLALFRLFHACSR